MKKVKYNYRQFENDCIQIANAININDYDAIVGIARGGVMLATMLSEISGNRQLFTIGYNSYNNTNKNEVVQTFPIHQSLRNKKILLCDDISDSGETLLRAEKDLKELNNEITILTLHSTRDTKRIPDISIYNKEKNEWIIYFWDKWGN